MKPQILRGSKQEIAETVARIGGEVREAIVFIEDPADTTQESPGENIFAEMEPFTVGAGDADCSREGVYSPTEVRHDLHRTRG
ncbi:MAG: hypothetical protein HY718_08250 [Planctomycetes bacterium]|nr:hypothetical protein [Planctomycetota bacterium]